ncbi:tetratricopeptide repeat protein [Elstera cyanobacteriorum]|uniref:TIR domain-containing protein n=1 Tax=Elstera cyanobacteriorum TaxID=2022747 RepID=A0A255XY86_9PROT|nr:tetratricopeptide repeat protein [Elstera cyanobacteriorum]OYQ21883.1 hypothetical protein CHR90_00905 [Elstera cyanobacteriorum]GGA02720.1 tetratricopeptide repeat protein [Elstera cyanobacteriorum]
MAQTQIFLSHRSSQKAFLKARLIPKLEPTFKVWLDEREIDPLEPITEEIRQAIAESHLFLAWWFDGYEESEPCHFELITALAHCRAEGEHSYQQRVFFAGPDAARNYAEAGIFKGLLAAPLSTEPTEAELDTLVNALKSRAGDALQPFGATKLDKANREAIAPNTNFVGRAKELLQLFGRMHAGRAGTEGGGDAVTLVSGMGGEGKTELAKEFARRFRAWYPGGVYRINLPGDAGDWAASGAALDQALADIADDFGILRPENATRRFVRGRIGEKLTTPYLWLLDDIRGGVSVEDLADFLPPNGHGTCLLTSRAKVSGMPEFDLERLSPSDGLRLLKRLSPTLADDMAAKLVDHVDGHALALNLIGRGVHSGTDPAAFLSKTGAALAPLEQVAARLKLGGAKVRPVLATLLTSLSLIPADHFARPLLGLLARLASAPVPVAFLQRFIGPDRLVPALEWLTTQGLLRETLAGGLDCRRLHPLMAEVVRELPEAFGAAESLSEGLTALDGVLRAELQAIIDDAGHFRRNALATMLMPHARHRAAVELEEARPDFAADLGSALYALGDLPGARALEEHVLDIRRRFLGPEHPDTLTGMNNLAETLRAQGDLPGARALQEQVLDAHRRALGPEHPHTLISMNNLAETSRAQGDLPSARALQEQVLDARRRLLGPEHPHTLNSMNNLAGILSDQGDLPGARALEERVVEIRRRILGPEHPDTLTSLSNLAGTLHAQGDFSGARALQEQVLEAYHHTLGPEHPDTLTSLSNLAGTHQSQGDLSGARVLQEQVLEARRRLLGPEHPDTLISMGNLASTLSAQGDLPGARALQEQVLEIHRRTLGPEHPDTITSLNNLAANLYHQGDLPGARALQEQVLEARRRLLGPEHPATLGSINNLAVTLLNLGKTAEARELLRPILPLLPTLAHAQARTALTDFARHLKLLPPEAP